MKVEVLSVKIKPSYRYLGTLRIRYGMLTMKCELVVYDKNKNPWIRMPEMWKSNEDKICFCRWDNKDISDQFQEEVLKQLKEQHGLSTERILEIHEEAKPSRNKSRKK